MNKTKIMSAIAALCLVCATAGCGGNSTTEEIVTEAQTGAEVNNPEVVLEVEDIELTGDVDYVTSVEEFQAKVATLLDMSMYTESSTTAGYYSIKEEHETKYEFDYKVAFNDGSEIFVYDSYVTLEAKGWKSPYNDGDQELKPGYSTTHTCKNAAGKMITTSPYNNTENTLTVAESVCHEVQIEQLDYDGAVKENVPGFTVCGSITNASTLEDIIEVLGNPSDISYYQANEPARSTITIEYNNAPYDYLQFEIDANSNLIEEMKYSFLEY